MDLVFIEKCRYIYSSIDYRNSVGFVGGKKEEIKSQMSSFRVQ